MLEGGFDLPPLMLTTDEVEAAVLGAQWVAGHADAALARAAQDLIAKISATVPRQFLPLILDAGVRTAPGWKIPPDGLDLAKLRASVRTGRKIALTYRDEGGRETRRTVWPVVIGYLDAARMLIAWCELRRDFRSFRVDRVTEAVFLEEPYPERAAVLRARWFASWRRDAADEKRPRHVKSRGDRSGATGRSAGK